ncbi:MAG TPA: hypothetical protein VEC99_18575, partial [Clostridia bacterium]|nr:hypothetical protein [Clostridia bacterium]
MNTPVRVVRLLALGAAVTSILSGCSESPQVNFVAAPPGPADLGPATGLSTPPQDAIVFDLKYRAQTGGADDLTYYSFWGYGGSKEETEGSSFLQDVRKKTSDLYYVSNYAFKDRKWSAIEYHGKQVSALYFDLDADGKLDENERIAPTRKGDRGFEFITPDFLNAQENGHKVLCRTLLVVNFYDGSSEPNCMWSPAALLEGT